MVVSEMESESIDKQEHKVMLKSQLLIATIFWLLLIPAHAAFDTPSSNSNGWGGWTRGDAGTMYAEWDTFETYMAGPFFDPTMPDSTPDVGSFNTTSSVLTVTSGSPIPTGSGNIYSPTTVLGFSLLMEGSEPTGATQVALQLTSNGNEFDYGSIVLNGVAATQPRIELSRGPDPGGLGEVVESLLIWDLLSNAGSYLFTFNGAATSVSLANVAVDIGASAVPIPAAAWLFFSGLMGITVFGRKKPDLSATC